MRRMRRGIRRAGPLAVGLALVAQMFVWGLPGAEAQGPGDPVDFRGFATGNALHLDALDLADDLALADLEVAWSSAAVDAGVDRLGGLRRLNEASMPFHSGDSSKIAYAMADSLELGLGIDPPSGETQLQLPSRVEADAPPSSSATDEVLELPLDPLIFAEVIRGDAVANTQDSGLLNELCVVGADIARGQSHVADLGLLDNNITAQLPESGNGQPQNVLQSTSRLSLIPSGVPGRFGLMAEMRQIYAPINIADTITLRVLGEWRLAAIATGQPGGARVEYGPVGAADETIVAELTIGDTVIPLTLEETPILSDLIDALGLNDPGLDLGLLKLTIGEQARALAAPGASPDASSSPEASADGRRASGAADVVRLEVLPGFLPGALLGGNLADLRVGHMEVSVEVPEGGIECPIPVSTGADPTSIRIGEEPDTSTIEITVDNVFDCDLDNLVLTDRIRPVEGTSPDFELTAANPLPDSPSIPTGTIKEADVVWSLGRLPIGESTTVTLDLTAAGPEGGVLEDIAEAQAVFVDCVGEDAEGLGIAGLDIGGFSVPVRVTIETPVTGAAARQTVAVGGALALLATALGLAFRRRAGVGA